jgi:hypothetical protein
MVGWHVVDLLMWGGSRKGVSIGKDKKLNMNSGISSV